MVKGVKGDKKFPEPARKKSTKSPIKTHHQNTH